MNVVAILLSLTLSATVGSDRRAIIRSSIGSSVTTPTSETIPILAAGFNVGGGLISEDPNTVSHVYWDGIVNAIPRSNTLTNAAWGKRGTGAATTDGTLCPDGSTANKITVGPAGTDDIFIASGYTRTTGAPVVTTFQVKLSSSTCAAGSRFVIGSTANGGNYGVSIDPTTLSTSTFTSFQTNGSVPSSGDLGAQIYGSGCVSGVTTMVLYLCQLQVEPDRTTHGTYIATGATAYRGGLIDSKGNTWTMNGTVTADSRTPFYPQGFSGPQQRGAGPFTDANYYSLGTGSDVLDFAGDFSACFVFIHTGVNAIPFANYQGAAGGFYVGITGSTNAFIQPQTGAGTGAIAPIVVNGPNILCFGRSGNSAVGKINLGTYVAPANTWTSGPCTTCVAVLGRYAGAGSPFPGTIVEAWFSTTSPSDALFTAIQKRFFSMIGSRGETMTVTRTTTGTYTGPDQQIWTAGPGIARIGCEDTAATKCGLLVEPARTNYYLFSEDFSNVVWADKVNLTVTTDQTTAPDGNLTADQVVAAAAGRTFQENAAVGNAAYTNSVWIKSASGTPQIDVRIKDRGTDTLRGNTLCNANASTWTRCVATGTTAGVSTGVRCELGFNTVATYFVWGAQCEAGSYATSYMPTAGVVGSRNADVVSLPNPFARESPGCVEAIFNTHDPAPVTLRVVGSTVPNADPAPLFINAAQVGIWDGSTTTLVAATLGGAVVSASGSWTGTTKTIFNRTAGTSLTGAFDGGELLGAPLYIGSGSAGANYWLGGYVRNLSVWSRQCR